MIIFGWRNVTMTGDKGSFHCPECGAGTRYEQKKVRRFFMLYFIPLIPLQSIGEYVECSGCKNTYKPEVLGYDPAAADRLFRAAWQDAVLRVMVRMVAADGRIADDEVESVRAIYFRLSGLELSPEEIAASAATTLGSAGSVGTDIEEVAPRLNDRGREMVMRAAIYVSLADGDVAEEEWKALADLARAMGMTPTHAKGVLHECMSEARAGSEEGS